MSSGSMRKVIFQFYGYLCTWITQVNFDLVIEYLIKYLNLLARSPKNLFFFRIQECYLYHYLKSIQTFNTHNI